MTQPASVPADGNLAVRWVASISNTAAPTDTEINAGSSVDISCALTSTGYQPTTEEGVIDDPRLCHRQTFERPGRFKDSLSLMYVHNPDSAPDNEAYLTLTHLTEGFIVTRWGVPYDQAFADGDIIDVYPVQCGVQQKMPPEENKVITVTQKMFVTGAVVRDAVVV